MRCLQMLLLFATMLMLGWVGSCSPLRPQEQAQEQATTEQATNKEPLPIEANMEPKEEPRPNETQQEIVTDFGVEVPDAHDTMDASFQQKEVHQESTPEQPIEAEPESVPESTVPKIPLVTSCTIPGNPKADSYEVKRDVVYATMDKQPQTLDIAWPKQPGTHPLVVMIHGGSWSAGDKGSYKDTITWLTGMGYAAATINYRLAKAPKNIFPAAVQDVRCAIRWLKANAKTYQIDPTRVMAIGFSAGAHLAAMLGTADNIKGLDSPDCPVTQPSVRVQGTVAYSGIYELLLSSVATGKPDPRVVNFLGAPPEKAQAKAKLASPLHHLDINDPPILVHHGTGDKTIPVAAARLFNIALKSVGIQHAYIEIPGGGHTGTFNKSTTYRTATCTTLSFMKTILQP